TRGVFPFSFGRQSIASPPQIIFWHYHAVCYLIKARRIDPFGLWNAFLLTEPVAIHRSLIPGHGDLRAFRIGTECLQDSCHPSWFTGIGKTGSHIRILFKESLELRD